MASHLIPEFKQAHNRIGDLELQVVAIDETGEASPGEALAISELGKVDEGVAALRGLAVKGLGGKCKAKD